MALMDYTINDMSIHLTEKFGYMSFGESDAESSITTHLQLKDEVTALRTEVATSIVNTNSTNPTYPDTAQFLAVVINSTGADQTLYEAGLQCATYGSSGDHLGARQTFSAWTVAAGETVGLIWKIVPTRG